MLEPQSAFAFEHPDESSGARCTPSQFPKTRYQGSKRRLVAELQTAFAMFNPAHALDLYSGTATVSLILKDLGWLVTANDYLLYNNATAELMLNCPVFDDSLDFYLGELSWMLHDAPVEDDTLVKNNFDDIYFYADENLQIDRFCQALRRVDDRHRNLYIYAVGQSLLMKRPYNLFHRANLSMRASKVKRTFGNASTWAAPIFGHASKIVQVLHNRSPSRESLSHQITNVNTIHLESLPASPDLVYIDPPYLNERGTPTDYCSFYHFLDGLVDYELFRSPDTRFAHRPVVSKPAAWKTEFSALHELGKVLEKWPSSHIVLSYRSDGRPTYDQLLRLFDKHGRILEAVDYHKFKYALSHAKQTEEVILISRV